ALESTTSKAATLGPSSPSNVVTSPSVRSSPISSAISRSCVGVGSCTAILDSPLQFPGWLSVSGSEKAEQGGILAHNGGRTLKRDRASLHHIHVVRHPQRELHMLLYKDHTHSAGEF